MSDFAEQDRKRAFAIAPEPGTFSEKDHTIETPIAKSAEDDLRDQLAALRKDFADLSRTAADGVAASVGAAGHRAADSARAARASVVDAVVEHPLAAIGLAAALGYLLAAMTRR